MSNSSLISVTKLSPNCNSPRNHKIDTITIHCAVGQLSAIRFCEMFSYPSRKASSNYVIGKDGEIALCVDESNRAWTSSNAGNDNRAITIECACDLKPPYAINSKVYNSLVALCVDICRRNGIQSLKWQNNKALIGQVDKQNMTIHRWFSATDCPGEYIYSHLGQIANDVNAKLGVSQSAPKPAPQPAKKSNDTIATEVINGAWGNGDDRKNRLAAAGYDYNAVMAIVNSRLNASAPKPAPKPAPQPAKKSNDTIATEVINGAWGNGDDRKNRLAAAGYDYNAVMAIVNSRLNASAPKPARKSNEEIAREVLAGKWGNGADRKNRLAAAGYDYATIQRIVNSMC